MNVELENKWKEVIQKLGSSFGEDINLDAILFLIGVQELGKAKQKFSKDQKIDIMHIAICTLLEPYGYYIYDGLDTEGWPHWNVNEKLPALKPMQQEQLMKQAIIDYFKEKELIA
jgi:hypothetical protein